MILKKPFCIMLCFELYFMATINEEDAFVIASFPPPRPELYAFVC